jgi:predicted transcriptional regulator
MKTRKIKKLVKQRYKLLLALYKLRYDNGENYYSNLYYLSEELGGIEIDFNFEILKELEYVGINPAYSGKPNLWRITAKGVLALEELQRMKKLKTKLRHSLIPKVRAV